MRCMGTVLHQNNYFVLNACIVKKNKANNEVCLFSVYFYNVQITSVVDEAQVQGIRWNYEVNFIYDAILINYLALRK